MDEKLRADVTEEIHSIVKSRISFLNENYIQIREAYQNAYNWPELDPLRDEICMCITFGLGQASITLTNHFLESLIKVVLISNDIKYQPKPSQDSTPTVSSFSESISKPIQKFNSNDLGDNINRLCTLGFISKEQKKYLHNLREDFRNAYSHSDKEKTFGDITINAQAVRVGSKGLEFGPIEESEVKKLIFAHGIYQAKQANLEAISYFLYIDNLARQLWSKLFGDQKID